MKKLPRMKITQIRPILGATTLSAIALFGFVQSAEAFGIRPGSDYVVTPSGSSFLDFDNDDLDLIPDGEKLRVRFKGRPIDPSNLGNTDTIIQRKDSVDPFSANPQTDIEIVDLSLVNDGDPGIPYDLFVTLNRDPDKKSKGTMTIRHEQQDSGEIQGTWDSQFEVNFQVSFTPKDDAPELDPVLLTKNFTANNKPWGHKPKNDILRLSSEVGDEKANCHSDDRSSCADDDFFIRGLAIHDSGDGQHGVRPAPEPLTILGSLTALGIGICLKKEYGKKNQPAQN